MRRYGFQRSGLKTGVENSMFQPEIGSGYEEPGGTPLPRISRSTAPRGGEKEGCGRCEIGISINKLKPVF